MSSKEVLHHIAKFLNGADRLLHRIVGSVPVQYAEAKESLPHGEALSLPYREIGPGERWGRSWEYGWFKGTVHLPSEAAGRRIELLLKLGGESTIYVNGRLAGAADGQHAGVTLSVRAEGGEKFELLAEAYAGHDRELPVLGESQLVELREELYQFYIDLKALYQLRSALPQESLRVAEIDKGFRKLIAKLDWTADGEAWERQAARGRELLKPLLDCVNGSTAPKLYMMGQSHLDIAWLWPIEETKRKIARTFSNQLALLEQYPEYRYVQSQPYLFRTAKELYPELYERISKYVAEGRIIPEGGAWVEPDTNLPSGESLIRQFLHGKRFFREEFGVDNELLWLPDVFGYSGNLPQIMVKSGIRCFASVKMYQTYDNDTDPFPYNTFMWEGIDGSAVPVHLLDYGPFPNPADVSYAVGQWNDRVQKEGISSRLVQFGYGDGGGGANRDDLEFLRRMNDLEGAPRTVISSPLEYFEDLLAEGEPEERYIGELYYAAHRGTFTSQAKMKKGNRAGEFALRDAELWSALAALRSGRFYPKNELDDAWKGMLLNQFHDILPGTSITRVHEEANAEFNRVRAIAEGISREAAAAFVAPEKEGLTLFNSLPWERESIFVLPNDDGMEWRTVNGEKLEVQRSDGQAYAKVAVPAMGHVSVAPIEATPDSVAPAETAGAVKATNRSLENEWLRVELNEYGEIASLFDKETGREWLSGIGNRFRMYRDQTSSYDAWEIDRRYADAEVALTKQAGLSVTAQGPLFAAIRVVRELNESVIVQDICLAAGSRRLEFRTGVEWKENHKLLKVGFDVALHAHEALHEIQFGYVRRPNHYSRPHDADRYETCQHKWSAMVEGDRCFSLLNDCKYGMNVKGKSMNLTLLRAPSYPDPEADRGWHEFTYALHVWNDGFMSNPVSREAYELNSPAMTLPGLASATRGLVRDCPDNVMLDAVKLAEDGSGDWIVRLYETKGASTTGWVTLDLPIEYAVETDMMEEREIGAPFAIEKQREGEIVEASGGVRPLSGIVLSFGAFEVKTIRMRMSGRQR